jgi:hypothetical protein
MSEGQPPEYMSPEEIAMHREAGLAYGREATCGSKVDYKSEDSAMRAARAMTLKHESTDGKKIEAYPCAWCSGWHVGREMSAEEKERFSHA